MAINLDHVTEQITVTDTATNASLTIQSKGTGAIDLAAGSSGVNLSNGGTVTAYTRTNPGSNLWLGVNPTVTVSAPTTAGGVQAVIAVQGYAGSATIQSGGTGYTVNDTLTLVGGTGGPATFTVSAVSAGVITSVTPLNFGQYSIVPTNPVSVTGGTGTGATLNVSYGLGTSYSITNAGSGYVEQPTLTISGQTSGSGAAAYATVGSGTVLRTLGSQIDFTTPGGVGFRVVDNGLVSNFPRAYGRAAGSGLANLDVVGSDTDITFQLNSKGTGAVAFYTNSGNQQQLRIAHTASAVNYVQVTGAATGSGPTISAQGSDANINLTLQSKGTGYLNLVNNKANYFQMYGADASATPTIYTWGSDTDVNFDLVSKGVGLIRFKNSYGTHLTVGSNSTTPTTANAIINGDQYNRAIYGSSGSTVVTASGTNTIAIQTGSTAYTQLLVSNTTSAVNYLQVTGAATGGAPSLVTQGSDTNIAMAISPKGSGILYLGSGGQTRISAGSTNTLFLGGSATGVNYVQISNTPSGFSPSYLARGSDANVGLTFGAFNDANIDFYASGDPNAGTGKLQLRVAPTASAVNYLQVTGAATGQLSLIQSTGSDTNSGLEIRLKGAPTGPGFRVANNSGATVCFAVQVSVASPVNYIYAVPTATGFGPVITASGSDTNIPLVLQPKGTGALQAQQTDSTATGGNARGANAVDWQMSRGGAAQVASSSYSVISGGIQNTSSAYGTVICGGLANTSSGTLSFVGGGQLNQATRDNSVVVGGSTNTAVGIYNFIGGGFTNTGTANATVTTQSATMNGTTAVTLAASNASIKVGQYITGTSIAGDTYVAAISGTSLTLSKAASGSSTSTLSFLTPHGVVVGGGNNTATGSYSFIGGGGDAGTASNKNVASGDWSVVGGGLKNTASGISSFVGGGGFNGTTIAGNTASGPYSVVGGGHGNTASASGASVLGGQGNVANSNFSTALNLQSTTRAIAGNFVYSSQNPFFPTVGGAQGAFLILGKITTDATPSVLISDAAGSASTSNQVILPNNSAYFFTGEVVAGVTGGGDSKGWRVEGLIKRGANAAATTLVGSTVTSSYADAGASTWTIAVTADTTNGGLAVTFTGQASTTIRTVAQIRTTEMTY